MPFTIGGEWIPEKIPVKPLPPIKVIKEKRKNSYVTLILHLSQDKTKLKEFCSLLKQHLGCGGSVKDEIIELQGDQIEKVKAHIKENKSSFK